MTPVHRLEDGTYLHRYPQGWTTRPVHLDRVFTTRKGAGASRRAALAKTGEIRLSLRPTAEQQKAMRLTEKAVRHVWNWAHDRKAEYRQKRGKDMSLEERKQLSKDLTQLQYQKGTEWLGNVEQQVFHQVLSDQWRVEQAGPYLKPLRPRDPVQFRCPQRVRIDSKFLIVPKLGRLAFGGARKIEEKVKGATFTQHKDRWFATLICENGDAG